MPVPIVVHAQWYQTPRHCLQQRIPNFAIHPEEKSVHSYQVTYFVGRFDAFIETICVQCAVITHCDVTRPMVMTLHVSNPVAEFNVRLSWGQNTFYFLALICAA